MKRLHHPSANTKPKRAISGHAKTETELSKKYNHGKKPLEIPAAFSNKSAAHAQRKPIDPMNKNHGGNTMIVKAELMTAEDMSRALKEFHTNH